MSMSGPPVHTVSRGATTPISATLLLQTVRNSIAESVPYLTDRSTRENAKFAITILDELSAREQLLARCTNEDVAEYTAIAAALDPSTRDRPSDLANAGSALDLTDNLRQRIVSCLRRRPSVPSSDIFYQLIGLEGRHARRRQEMVDSWTRELSMAVESKPSPVRTMTLETCTNYFRERFQRDRDLAVTKLEIVPGGRSKQTAFLNIDNATCLPARIVMRQDAGVSFINTTVKDEFPWVKYLFKLGLPVAEPLLLETERTALGSAFMLCAHVPGEIGGSYFGFTEGAQGWIRHLAQLMAELHAVNLGTLASALGWGHQDYHAKMRATLRYYREQWIRCALEPSPLIEYAFAWLEAEYERDLGEPALVHGDIGPHNILIHRDKIVALLDWEFVHVGSPGEDLGYRRSIIESVIPWREFMRLYRDAGGREITERELLRGSVWGLVRNASFGAGASHEFAQGRNADICNAAGSLNLNRYWEAELASAFERHGAHLGIRE
jgi:aminoglycoside phosphotransferase (APT) family kinase protein